MTRFSAPFQLTNVERRRCNVRTPLHPAGECRSHRLFHVIMTTRVSSSGGSIATVRPQPRRDLGRSSTPLISFWITIRGQNDLLVTFQQRIEGVEKFLRSFFIRKELNVIDQQRINRTIIAFKLFGSHCFAGPLPCPERSARVHIHHFRIGLARHNAVTHRVQKVRLPRPVPP